MSHNAFMRTKDDVACSRWAAGGCVFHVLVLSCVVSGGWFQFWLLEDHGVGGALSDTCSQYVRYIACCLVLVL